MAFILVYITYGNEESAQHVSRALIEEKMVACAHIYPIQSGFWWKGDIASEEEWVSLLKTIPENWKAIQEKVNQLHPYEVPAIIKIEAEANEAYEKWLREEVKIFSA